MNIHNELAAFDASQREAMKAVDAFTKQAQLIVGVIRETQLSVELPAIARPLTFRVAEGIRREARAMDRVFDSLRATTRIAKPHYPKYPMRGK